MLAAAALPVAAATAAGPDAALLAACAEFDALERRHSAICRAQETTEQEEANGPTL